MPLHLTRTAGPAAHPLEVGGRRLIASHEQIAAIVRSRLGQAHADLLAIPKPTDSGAVDWSTRLHGAVTPAASLPLAERQQLERDAERLLADIRGLAMQLQAEGTAASMVGRMLERVTRFPVGDWLYRVGDAPVLVLWGHSDAPETSPPAVAAPAAAEPETPVESTATMTATAPTDRRHLKGWLMGALLLLALAAAVLAGVRRCGEQAARGDDLAARVGAAAAANQALESYLAKARAEAAKSVCVRAPAPEPEPPLAAPATVSEAPPERVLAAPPASAPPRSDPYESLTKKIAASTADCKALAQLLRQEPMLRGTEPQAKSLRQQVQQSLQQNCREAAIKEARNMCPGERPRELAPELVLVFDASGSMGFSLNATDEEIQQMAAMEAMQGMMKLFGGGRGGNPDLARFKREPTRITAARQAALAAVRKAPSDANIGLVLVDVCPAARSAGFYPPARRGELLGGLQSVQPNQGTPLADGVARAGALIDGVRREALMVVISDGKESCGQDPCAVGRALARAKPHLKINVVDILGTGAGNCLAQATGGKVFTARNADEVAAMTRRASEELGPANCAKQ